MNETIDLWLIEDHKSYGERLARALNRFEGLFCSRRFTACEDAFAALAAEPAPQVLLLDVGLPGINGIDALARLRELAPGTAIVILTVFEDDDKIFRAICAGASGYLLKTANTTDLAAAIRSAAAGGSPINPMIARRVLDRFSKVGASAPSKDYGLTAREKEILQLLVQGYNTKEAAARLQISYHTADGYIREIYEKLQVNTRSGMVAKAIKEGLTT
jgi:DNA-binding NarL/FixJ family response regulator